MTQKGVDGIILIAQIFGDTFSLSIREKNLLLPKYSIFGLMWVFEIED